MDLNCCPCTGSLDSFSHFPFPSPIKLVWSLDHSQCFGLVLMCKNFRLAIKKEEYSYFSFSFFFFSPAFFFFFFNPVTLAQFYFQQFSVYLYIALSDFVHAKETTPIILLISRHWFWKHMGRFLIFLEFLFWKRKSCLYWAVFHY